ncbi:hypothetical protein Tco_0800832 [Tanacetum coccineum]|uniref:Uncharacterized protein n=1 Tax=Tanacetum coccineum TaxID=301880 RepID=A0ABQ4ZUA7_9ASTR
MSLNRTCTSSGILCTSMTPSTDSRLTRRNDSNLLWKSSEISFRFSQEYRVETLIPFLLKKTICINPRELLLLLSIGVYLERLMVLTSFTIITNHNRTKGKNLSELMLPLQLRTVGGPFDQELQKQGANHWKKSATSDSYLSYMWRERTLCKSVMKDHQQQCPGESLHAKG